AASPVQLQRVVSGCGDVVRLTDRSESFERTQVIEIGSGVRRHCCQRRLVDIGFTLQMKTSSSHISDGKERLQEKLSLKCHVPIPRFRSLEGLALGGYHQRDVSWSTTSGIID